MSSTTLSIRVDETAKARLQALAESTGRSSSFLAAEALDTYLDLQEWQVAAIKKGIESLDKHGGVPHAEVKAWVESWGTDKELPRPKARHR
jgi:RHH-type transcriptional regulator, rel operon repressor / antitoxin RelB